MAALQDRGGSAQGRCRMAGTLSSFLGAELRSLGRVSAPVAKKGEEAWTQTLTPRQHQQSESLLLPVSSMLRVVSFSKPGPSPIVSRSGGDRAASPRFPARWINVLVGPGACARDHLKGRTMSRRACFVRSWNRTA